MCLEDSCHRIGRRSLLATAGVSALGAGLGLTGSGMSAASAQPAARSVRRGELELTLLGTQAGPPVQQKRVGISTVLTVAGVNYVIDCGRSSVTQYVQSGLRLRDLRSILITHLHADHVADYYNYFMLGGHIPNEEGDNLAGPVKVFGPGSAGALPPKYGGGSAPVIAPDNPTPGLADLTESCHRAFAYSSNIFMRDTGIRDIRTLADVHEIAVPDVGADPLGDTAPRMAPFVVFEDDRVRVTAVLVPHGPAFPSFAFRFDTDYGSVVFSGDTRRSDNLIRLARDADVLVHEAINVRGANLPDAVMNHMLQSHVEVQEVGPIAEAAGARHLVLSHIGDLAHHPLDPRQWSRWAQQGYSGRVTVGEELMRIAVPSRGRRA